MIIKASLTKDKVIWTKELPKWTSTDGIHGTWFQIHKDGSWNVTAAGGFIKVNVDAFQLKIGITVVCTCWVNTVFVGDDFPELGTNLVTALASLNVNDFSHL